MKSTLADCLVRFLEKEDKLTFDHSLRVGYLAIIMAEQLRHWPETDRQALILGCFVHDIGKLRIPLTILHKPSALTAAEWKMIKHHPEMGVRMLRLRKEPIDERVFAIARHHHERWDGTGYPSGLRGAEIPVFSRICAILDAFDTMVSDRPYRKGRTIREAKEELRRHRGTQFDAEYADWFISLPDEMLEIPNDLHKPMLLELKR